MELILVLIALTALMILVLGGSSYLIERHIRHRVSKLVVLPESPQSPQSPDVTNSNNPATDLPYSLP